MSPSAVHSSRKKHLSNQKLNVCFPSCPNCRVLVSFQVSQNPDNDGRCFVISYFPSNDMISIFENPTRNSGITSGKFLEKTRVRKPGSTVDNPQFYSPADFAIGATIRSNPSILILHRRTWTVIFVQTQRKVVSDNFSVMHLLRCSLLDGNFFVICSVSVFSHRFLLTDADLFVLTYLEANADNIPPQTLESVRRKLNADGTNDRAWAQMGTEDQT